MTVEIEQQKYRIPSRPELTVIPVLRSAGDVIKRTGTNIDVQFRQIADFTEVSICLRLDSRRFVSFIGLEMGCSMLNGT